ncbi:hypothetical protein [Ferruginibacter sp.]|nr:hypothetical protein [Ferruginibacter sp.]
MSTVIAIISKNSIRDIHGLLLDIKSEIPGILYQFGEDESKYNPGFQPDVFAWVHQKSTRYLDWSSERDENYTWHYTVRIPACSNCPIWQLSFLLIEKIASFTDGRIFTEEMDIQEDTGFDIAGFQNWKTQFSCEKKLKEEIELTIDLSESEGDVTIFGTHAPFTLNKNIISLLKSKKSAVKEFEKRMLQLQNAVIDELYTNATDALVRSQLNHNEYRVKVCTGLPFNLVINEGLDYIIFSKKNCNDLFFVPAKKIREVMPTQCFFDEYSFFVDNESFATWENIMEKAKMLHEEV